jgi:hypothetical protein
MAAKLAGDEWQRNEIRILFVFPCRDSAKLQGDRACDVRDLGWTDVRLANPAIRSSSALGSPCLGSGIWKLDYPSGGCASVSGDFETTSFRRTIVESSLGAKLEASCAGRIVAKQVVTLLGNRPKATADPSLRSG